MGVSVLWQVFVHVATCGAMGWEWLIKPPTTEEATVADYAGIALAKVVVYADSGI